MAAAIAKCAFEVRDAITDPFVLAEAVRMCSTTADSIAVLMQLGM